MAADRDHDLVLFGATGFTGGLTAEHLATHPEVRGGGLRWALAGRSREKLAAVRTRLCAIDPELAELPLLVAEADDRAALDAVARSTRAVLTTVGPFALHGEGLVAACAAAGTDYLDSTGEPEFIDRMYLAHHMTAQATGARLIHACGFDSIPADLGTLFTVERLPEGVPLRVEAFLRIRGATSGGTYHSAVRAAGRLPQAARAHGARRRAEPLPSGRSVRAIAAAPHRDPAAGGWAVPLPVLDPQIVLRSAAALPRYGPDFAYGHYLAVRRVATVAGLVTGAGSLALLASVPPVRAGLLRLRSQGEGPDDAARQRSHFRLRLVGRPAEGPDVVCELSGSDPGYGGTAAMLAESALCLLGDELAPCAGQVTSAQALGARLIDRLQGAALDFRVITDSPA